MDDPVVVEVTPVDLSDVRDRTPAASPRKDLSPKIATPAVYKTAVQKLYVLDLPCPLFLRSTSSTFSILLVFTFGA